MIGGFRSVLFESVFEGSLAVAIIVTDSSEKRNLQLGLNFRVRILLKSTIIPCKAKLLFYMPHLKYCQLWHFCKKDR